MAMRRRQSTTIRVQQTLYSIMAKFNYMYTPICRLCIMILFVLWNLVNAVEFNSKHHINIALSARVSAFAIVGFY
jgi:hypothetical protein